MNAIRILRTLQCYAPFLRPLKFSAYNLATKSLGWRVEPEFNFLSRFAPVGLALDIGGNWGQSILAFGRTAKPRHTMSFEPNPILAKRLHHKYATDACVEIHSCALGDVAGEFELFVPQYRNFVFDGLASLDEGAAAEWLNSARMAAFEPARLRVKRHIVQVRTLDSFATAPDVVKIDVQGFEYQVVKGGEATFRQWRPVTIVEAPTDELVDLFADMGLAAYGYSNGTLIPGDTGGTNTLFIHPDRIEEPREVRN